MQQPAVNFPFMGTCTYNTPSVQTVLLMNVDPMIWAEIQGETAVATSSANTYIALNSGFVSSTGNVPNSESTVQVTDFTSNTNPPVLLGCIIDQTSRILGMMFSEGVIISSVVPTGLTIRFFNTVTSMMVTYTLTGGQVMAFGQGTSQVGIVLSDSDYAVLMQGSSNTSDYSITLAANSATDGNGMINLLQNAVPVFSIVTESGQTPQIVSFTPDFFNNNIELGFSVPSQNFSFNQMFVTNQSSPFIQAQSYSLSGSALIGMVDQVTIQIQVPSSTFSAIMSDATTCTDITNCFIFWQNGSFVDINGIPTNEPFQAFQALAIIFNVDTTSPVLMEFSINLLNGNLSLTFSELVFADVLDVAGLILTDGLSRQERLSGTVDATMIPMSGLSMTVTVLMSFESLEFAKLLPTPRLAAYGNTTTDNSGNQLTPISIANSLIPMTVVADTVPPGLVSFQPSPQDQNIVMMFDESINPASWNESLLSLTLQIATGDVTYSSFTGGLVSLGPPENLTYTFSSAVYTSPFSTQYTEASRSGAVILNVQPGLVADVSGNLIETSSQFRYSILPPDTTQPTLITFVLDMNAGTLQMTFSEPVSLSPAAGLIQFYDQSNFGSSNFMIYTLTENGTYSINLQNGPSLTATLALTNNDLNAIKANRQLCISQATTFLGPFPSLAQDRAGNNLQSVSSGIPASRFIPDMTAPNVVNWGLDLNAGEMRIRFSEAVAINYTTITVLPTMSAQQGVTLSGDDFLQYLESDALASLSLTMTTLNRIKSNQQICTDVSNCYLSVPQASYSDTNANAALADTILRVSSINPDITRPNLLAYTMDLNSGSLTLTFDEAVDLNSFNPTSFNFRTPPGAVFSQSNPISDAVIQGTSSFDTILTVQLGMTSLNQVKSLAARTSLNFSATVDFSFLTDTSSNVLVSIDASSPLAPQVIMSDNTRPQLIRFLPQYPSATDITFFFDEVVNISSFQINSLTMSLSTVQGTFTYSGFSEGSFNGSNDGSALTYTFSTNELNSTLSSQFTAASQRGSVSLTVSSSFVMDLFSNTLFPITNSNPIVFTTDTQRPVLLNYNLDLNRGLLELSFSEPVNINPNPSLVQFQNMAAFPTSNISLTGFFSVIPDNTASDSLMIYLTTTDILTLISNSMIATLPSNTYLLLLGDFASDLSGNQISPNASALQVSNLILDTTGPSIVSSQLDLNQGSLRLDFSESIDSGGLVLSQIYITGMMSFSPTGYNLEGSTFTTAMNLVSSVTFQLNASRLTSIKSDLQVCSSSSNCFIFVSGGTFRDASGNPNQISSRNISSIFEDIVPPVLTSYALDLDAGRMVMTFSEPIITSSFDASQVTLLAGTASQSLQQVTVASFESFNSVVRLSIGSSLLNQIKRLATIGNIMLSMTSSAVTDTNNLLVVAIPPVNALLPSPFTPDSTTPTVTNFIPSSGGQLTFTLVFDEFVLASSLLLSQLSFQLRGREGQFEFPDLSSAMVADLGDRLVLSFPTSETRFSQTNATFQDIYLSSYSFGSITFVVLQGFITDISGNSYNGPLTFTFTNSSDTIRPTLTSFTLDLNTGQMTLIFSEDVNILTVVGNAGFGNTPMSPSSVYNIMQEPQISTLNSLPVSSTAFVQLNLSDVDNIVANPSIGTSTSNTYLYLQERFAVDASGNYLDPSNNVQASQVVQRVVIIRPQLTSFDFFSLDNQTMVLSFNLPVNINTTDVTQISLYSSVSLTTSFTLTLTGGSFYYRNENQTTVAIQLLVDDIRAIKQISGLATSNSNTYVRITGNAFVDSQGSPVLETPIPIPLAIGGFVPDTTGPSIISYTFNLTSQKIVITFSDPVVSSTANPTQLTIQNLNTQSFISSYTLTAGVIQSPSTTMFLEMDIADFDFNMILSMLDLATSPSNTFLSCTSQFIRDTDGNNVIPIPPSNALAPNMFGYDTLPPSIISFSLDMNIGQIQLTFSEPLLSSSLNISELSLQNALTPTIVLPLANESFISNSQSPTISILAVLLSENSLNAIKAADGFSAVDNSFISTSGSFATDTSSNPIMSGPTQSSAYTPDTTRPSLVAFDVNIHQTNVLLLYFSEPITFSSNDVVTTITLQNAMSNPTVTRPLGSNNIVTVLPSLVDVQVRLGDGNLIRDLITDSAPIATSVMDLYISLSSANGFTDFAMNEVSSISDSTARRVRLLCKLRH